MLKIIKTRTPFLLISFFFSSFLSAQTFVDLSLTQIITPDSVLYCDNKDIPIKVVVKLFNGLPIDSFRLSYQLSGRTSVVEKVYKRLSQNDTFQYVFSRPLSKDSLFNGQGALKVSVSAFSPAIDYSSNNNDYLLSLRNSVPKNLPYTMNFDGTTLPPLDWMGIKRRYYDSGNGGYIKEYVAGINSSNTNSLVFQLYNATPDSLVVVKTPVFDLNNIDLPYFYFNHAYGNGGLDTFEIELTQNCGATYQTLFRKGGSQLWTMETNRRDPYTGANWGRDSINLSAFVGQKVQLRMTYRAKTNDILYLDDVLVANRNVLNKDLILLRRIQPDNTPICPSDRKQTPVEIVFKNAGKAKTDTINLSFKVNNGSWITEKLIKQLDLDDSLRFTFTQLMTIPDTGAVVLSLTVAQKGEQNTVNDTLIINLNVRREYAVPFKEGFETAEFPPKDWPTEEIYFSSYGTTKEARVIGSNGQPTAAVYFTDHGGTYSRYLTTAAINLKGIRDPYLGFDRAYSSSNHQASLTVEVSTDCGLTFQPIYFKRGDTLKTYDIITYSGPTAANQWRRDSVSLLSFKDKDVMIRFVGYNSFSGRAVFIDNIDVFNRNTPQKDVALTNIKTPVPSVICPVGQSVLPIQIGISNTGLAKVDTFIVSYKIDNSPSPIVSGSTTVSDTVVRPLAFGETYNHTFQKLPSFPKGGTLTFFYTVKTIGDLDNRNDTLSNRVTFPTQNSLTYNEGFEVRDIYNNPILPKEWVTENYGWISLSCINSNGATGLATRYAYSNSISTPIVLKSPFIDFKKAGNPYLTFDLAYARYDTNRINRLKIEVSTDCGKTFRPTNYDKMGKALETFNTTAYYPEPLAASNWRRDTVNLTAFKDSLIIIRFVGYSSDGTPLYVDNVKVEAGFAKDASVAARFFPDTTPVCYPNRNVPVRMVVRNDGVTPIDTFTISYRLDTEGVVSQTFIKHLNYRDTAVLTFSQLMNVQIVGNHSLTLILAAKGDENSQNDTLVTTFRLLPQYKTNILEGFETANFPPTDWTIQRSNPGYATWATAQMIGSRGDSTTAIYMRSTYSSDPSRNAAQDAFTTYPVDLSGAANPIALFDVAYLGFKVLIGGGTDTSNTVTTYYEDTLRIDISTDCGQTFRPTGYKKTKAALTTNIRTYESIPNSEPGNTNLNSWRRDSIDLSAYSGGVVQLRFVHIAPVSYNSVYLYLDNVQFVNYETKNLSLFNWVTPNDSTILCQQEAFPIEVKLINEGKTPIDTFTIKYQIDNQAEVTETASVMVNPHEIKNHRFAQLLRGATSGEHTLRAVIHAKGDTIRAGDTLTRKITVGTTYNVPVIETFEGTFPPQDWQVQDRNSPFITNWIKGWGQDVNDVYTRTAMYFTNLANNPTQDALISWKVSLQGMKNPYLVFDIAAWRHYLQDKDSFRIEYSTDCANTWQRTAYNKSALQLITDQNPSLGNYRFPNRNQWRSDSVRLFALKDSLVQFRFSAVRNVGMIIHLDNIRVVDLPFTKTDDLHTSPQYSRVFPNPTTGDLTIEFNQNTSQPIDCQLRNAQGQVVKHQKRTVSNQEAWQLQNLPAGVYFLYININNQVEKHKIVLIK